MLFGFISQQSATARFATPYHRQRSVSGILHDVLLFRMMVCSVGLCLMGCSVWNQLPKLTPKTIVMEEKQLRIVERRRRPNLFHCCCALVFSLHLCTAILFSRVRKSLTLLGKLDGILWKLSPVETLRSSTIYFLFCILVEAV